jgi:hypothetical protein
MTKSQIDAIIERLDAHSQKLDAVRSDVDRIMGGVAVIGVLVAAGLLGAIFSALSK